MSVQYIGNKMNDSQELHTGNMEKRETSFAYLDEKICYMDSACQTMRPQCVIDAEREYYMHTNACGGRVKYRWGKQVDEAAQDARNLLLLMTGKSAKDYTVAFTLNTTYGINLLLSQIDPAQYERIVTTNIEHNSVFLPSMTWAKRKKKERHVLSRSEDGSVEYEAKMLKNSIVILNTMSNIDGRMAHNLEDIIRDTHVHNGIVILDAAQGFAHDTKRLKTADFDALCGSGHKAYGPSIGFIVIKKTLLNQLDPFFIGGGCVQDVRQDSYDLLREGEESYAILEPGLQNWAGIAGLRAALLWLKKNEAQYSAEKELSEALFEYLQTIPRITLVNAQPSAITSLYVKDIDAHRLALYLDEQNIMCRSGYFCCHAYLLHERKLPPLLRLSLGLQNTPKDVEHVYTVLKTIMTTL